MQSPATLRTTVADVVERTPVFDIHTHLYDPAFGELLLWGIDELLVYHYLIAEGFRQFDLPYDQFWAMTKTQQADAIWQALFIDHSPISEACRGVLTVLNALGLEVKKRDLPKKLREAWNPLRLEPAKELAAGPAAKAGAEKPEQKGKPRKKISFAVKRKEEKEKKVIERRIKMLDEETAKELEKGLEDEDYRIEKILKHSDDMDGVRQYKVRYVGYGPG